MSAPTLVTAFPTPPSSNLVTDPPAHPLPMSTPPTDIPTDTQIPDSIIASTILSNAPISPPPTSSPTMGNPQKEAAPVSENHTPPETAPLIELHETEAIPEEVEGWLQKLNQAGDINLQQPITHDGDIMLANTEAQVVKEKLVLPLSESGVNAGLKNKVTDSARWLAEWCVRLVKMIKDGVKYAPETVTNPPKKPL